MNLPVRFPRDPYCRALTRAMLCVDESGALYLGLTPDGVQPGRDALARLSLLRGETPLDCAAAQEDGAMLLRAPEGYVRLRLGFPERLMIEGEGVSLLLGKGRAVGMFMSGGSAVDDTLPGAIYVNAGARLRILPTRGSVEVRSAWDLNALSDPDPRILLRPDKDGVLEAEIFITDFDAEPVRDPAPEAEEAFGEFCRSLTVPTQAEEARHAAYVFWTALQPARALALPQITAPLYVSNRRSLGTARTGDNVLLAALLRDPAQAHRQLCAAVPYLDESGLLPCALDNRSRLYEAEIPYFGVVYRARPELKEQCALPELEAQLRALGWWRRERWCPTRRLFYALHRFEPGCGMRLDFPEKPPEFAPELNICLLLWMEALADISARFGRAEDAAELRGVCGEVRENLTARLWTGTRWQRANILNEPQSPGRGEGCMASLADGLPGIALPEKLPWAYVLPVLLAGDEKTKTALAARVTEQPREICFLRDALTLLAAFSAEGGCRYAL